MWRPPPRRAYQPKLMDPGQVVVWRVRVDGHYAVPPHFEDGEYRGGTGWVEASEYERIGTVWSQATSASSWWVVPEDEDPDPVVVRRAGKSYKHHFPEGMLYQSGECAGWRDAIRRAEHVRRHGLYAVVTQTEKGSYDHWSRRQRPDTRFVSWHSDPECPSAARYERWDGEGFAYHSTGPDGETWTPATAADVLVGRVQYASDPPFCGQCVMLLAATPTRAGYAPAA
jgi:hypothetical protein